MSKASAILERVETERLKQTQEQRPRRHAVQIKPFPQLQMLDLVDWFFNEGQTRFEKSVTGAILEQARLGNYTSRRCEKCDGSGVLGNYQDMLLAEAKWRNGEKRPIMSGIEAMFGSCPECGGRGSKETRSKAHRQQYSKDAPFEPLDELTVRPNPKKAQENKSPPDDTDLTRYASCSRALSFVAPASQEILAAAFGPHGRSWSDTLRGREWAVIPLTDSGRWLLACDGMPHDKRAASLLDEIGTMASAGRLGAANSKLLKEAVKEARKALETAIREWNALFEVKQ